MTLWTELLDARAGVIRGRHVTRVLEAGSGPGLLLLHGQGGSLENFRRNIPAYAEHAHVVAIDLQWHGRSGAPPVDPELIPAWSSQVEEVVSNLGWTTYAIEGQSLGGWIAARHAMDHPERVTALVLTTPMGLDPLGQGLDPAVRRRVLDAQLETLRALTPDAVRRRMEMLFLSPEEVDDEIVELRRVIYADPAVNVALAAVAQAYLGGHATDRFRLGPGELGRLAVPTLVYWGSANIGGDAAGKELAAAIPGARYHCAEASHWAQYEKADEHNRVVLEFLHEVDAIR